MMSTNENGAVEEFGWGCSPNNSCKISGGLLRIEVTLSIFSDLCIDLRHRSHRSMIDQTDHGS